MKRNLAYVGNGNYKLVTTLSGNLRSTDAHGYRKEFVELVKKAGMINKKDVATIDEDY